MSETKEPQYVFNDNSGSSRSDKLRMIAMVVSSQTMWPSGGSRSEALKAMKNIIARSLAALFLGATLAASGQSRWKIQDDGGIAWDLKRGEAHYDNVEMSGEKVSVILTYGADSNGVFTVKRQVVFPTLRFQPNQTHHPLALDFGEDASPRLFIGPGPAATAAPRNFTVTRVRQKGIVRIDGTLGRNREFGWT